MLSKEWTTTKEYKDITYKKRNGVIRIAFNRPEVRNAFRPQTVDELLMALDYCHHQTKVGSIILTGNGPSPKDGGWAFVPVEIKGFEVNQAISMEKVPLRAVSTSLRFKG